jgi:hypothetical protein
VWALVFDLCVAGISPMGGKTALLVSACLACLFCVEQNGYHNYLWDYPPTKQLLWDIFESYMKS